MSAASELNRRKVLRGMLGGGAVTVGLPLLGCFLNANGTALATGAPLPLCFGTWFWGLGLDPGFWEPKTAGAKYEFGPQLQALEALKDKINVFSGMKVMVDANPSIPHNTGWMTCATGNAKLGNNDPTFDVLIGDAIGARTRFRSLEVACDGTKTSVSRRGSSFNPAELSPVALYTRIFGPEFKDPNAADFTPDPDVMMRKSALSAVTEQRQSIAKKLDAADRARLDEYFTSLRSLEQQLELELQKPAPLEACTVPAKSDEATNGAIIGDSMVNHKIFSGLLAHAMACGQTQVVNLLTSEALSGLRHNGSAMTYHLYTHEEATDPNVGYQVQVQSFRAHLMVAFADFLTALDSIKEGNGTLLDRTLIAAFTDTGYAKAHSIENIPLMTAGRANGRIKTGMHVVAKGDTVARFGLTVQQAMGVRISSWGTELNTTSRAFNEILA